MPKLRHDKVLNPEHEYNYDARPRKVELVQIPITSDNEGE